MTDQDKRNINSIYLGFKAIVVPEMESEQAKELAGQIRDSIEFILTELKERARRNDGASDEEPDTNV